MGTSTGEKSEEEHNNPLYGDVLEAILSHVPPLYLLPAYLVSKQWQRSIISSSSASSSVLNPHASKPWLIIHVQSPRSSKVTTHAYDPNSHVWIDITRPSSPSTTATPASCSPVRSSNSGLLYTFPAPSKLAISFDALNDTWQVVDGPRVWRRDPIVAVVGNHVVVAGGTYLFEADPMAVETYDMESHDWTTCESVPDMLTTYCSAMWLSMAASDQKMFLLEKNSGKFCSFDPITNTWAPIRILRPNPSIFFSVIGLFSSNQLVLIGLLGDIYNVESLRLWEVTCDTFHCKEITKMPAEMLERLASKDSSLSSINVSMVQDVIYIYNPSNLKDIFLCEFTGGVCQWGSVRNLTVNDRNWMHRFEFTCSKVGFNDLKKVFRPGNRKFTIKEAGRGLKAF